MFGGHGLYCGEDFFAIAFRGRLYFRVDDATRPGYEARGSQPFCPDGKTLMRGYYEVPIEVLEDTREVERWAMRAALREPRKHGANLSGA